MPNSLRNVGPATACTLLRLWLEGEVTLTRTEVQDLTHIIETELESFHERVAWLDGWVEAKAEA